MWLIPSTLSPSAPGLECLMSDSTPDLSILESQAERLPMRNGTPMPPRSLLRSWKQDAWMRRLCGAAIWDESKANRFVAESMPLSAASHASPIALPEVEKEPTTNAGSGPTSSTSFVTLVHGSWCLRTSEDFFQAEAWVPYSQTFPVSGSMRNGQCFLRERLALRTGGSASLSSASSEGWRTPKASEDQCDRMGDAAMMREANRPGAQITVSMQARQWQTPNTDSFRSRGGDRKDEMGLDQQSRFWNANSAATNSTPNVADTDAQIAKGKVWATTQARMAPTCKAEAERHSPSLEHQAVAQWPTPASRDHKGANSIEHVTETGGGAETHGSIEQLCSLFAPGPSDPSWPDILRNQPWLAPATESGVCMHVDGLALMVDESRRDQLRCVGNGVVPLCASVAIVGLIRRLT